MKSATLLDKKINSYLTKLSIPQKKALLTVAETFAEEQENENRWGDKAFVAEMDKRFEEYESGKIKAVSLESLEQKAKQSYSRRKAKK